MPYSQQAYQKAKSLGYSDDQINTYLSRKQKTAQPKKPSVIGNAVKSLVSPVTDYAGLVGEAAFQGGRAILDPQMRKATFNPGGMSEEDWIKLGNKKQTAFVDPNKLRNRKEIAKTGLKRTAGAAAMAIPGSVGAKGLAGVATSGAISGGLLGLSQGDDISAKNIFTGAVTGGVTAPAMKLAGDGVKGLFSKASKKGGNLGVKKLGQKIEKTGKDYAVRSTRINQSQQNKFKTKTGKDLADYITDKGLYGQDVDKVDDVLKPLYAARKQAIRGNNQMIDPQQVIADFNAKIAEYKMPGKIGNPDTLKKIADLEKARDLFADDAVAYAQSVGDQSVSKYPLELLDKLRSDIDQNTTKAQFLADPANYNSNRRTGNVYRNRVNDTAGTRGVGLEIRDAEAFKDAIESAPKGRNTLPAGLNRGMWATAGGVATKLPFVGEMLGAAGEAIANNPTVIGATSRGIQSVGKGLQNAPSLSAPAMPQNAFFSSLRQYAGKLPVAGAVGATTAAISEEEVQSLSEQTGLTPEQAREVLMNVQKPQPLTGMVGNNYIPNM